MREAVVLAGGEASRLGEIAAATPKPLLTVAGRPFLDHVLFLLARHGIERVVLATGRLSGAYRDYRPELPRPLEIVLSAEDEPMGTGGALALAARHVEGDSVLVLNGDTLFDLNYLDLEQLRRESGTSVAIGLREVADAARYGSVELDGERVAGFAEKQLAGPGLVSGGVYAMDSAVLRSLATRPHSFERDVLPGLVANGRVAARAYVGYFVDIGLPDSLESARAALPEWRRKPAVIFDRDGVLNVDHGHVATPDRFEWTPTAVEAIKAVNDAGLLAFVVTNQAGIAKGFYTAEEYAAFERWISEQLASHGAHVDATYHCPHHPEATVDEYRAECECRKPQPGMIRRLMAEWEVETAVLIGDKPWDMQAAHAAGIRGVPYEGGDLVALVRPLIAEMRPLVAAPSPSPAEETPRT